jgi:hypothetical protein
MDRERAEAYLRLLAEAELRRWSAWAPGTAVSHRLALVTHALCTVGAIDSGTGEQIQAELDLLLSCGRLAQPRRPAPVPRRRHRRWPCRRGWTGWRRSSSARPLDRGTAWVDVVAAGQSAEVRATLPLPWRQSELPSR